MGYLRIVNWERQQHYGDRRTPPWIRLYNELLDDYRWAMLPDAAKAHLVGLYLLASRTGNLILDDPAWIATRIGAESPVALAPLIDAGFLLRCDGEEPAEPAALQARPARKPARRSDAKTRATLWETGASALSPEESRGEDNKAKACEEGLNVVAGKAALPAQSVQNPTHSHTPESEVERGGEGEKASPPAAQNAPPPASAAPSAAQVRGYAQEIGFGGIDAERFINFYAAKGWFSGASPITDWKPLVRNWRKTERLAPPASPRAGPGAAAPRKGALNCGQELMIELAASHGGGP